MHPVLVTQSPVKIGGKVPSEPSLTKGGGGSITPFKLYQSNTN